MSTYVIGSLDSDLARAMVKEVLRFLAEVEREFPDAAFEHRQIAAIRDVKRARILNETEAYANGSFTAAIDQALAHGEIDVAVHSLKDLAVAETRDLIRIDPPCRADARDALCGHTLAGLPDGARVGTGSPRRAAQLLAVRPDIRIVRIRGDVRPRLELMAELGLDALLLAAAGLDRLGLSGEIAEYLDPAVFVPAPGQGVMGIEIRENSEALEDALLRISHPLTTAAARAERRVLAELRGTCSSPIGAYAVPEGESQLRVHGQVTSLDGATVLKATAVGEIERADALGREVAYGLVDQGADEVLALSESSLGRLL
jgi:hydroxymethylbilane synthase